jgi:hypothetical protein
MEENPCDLYEGHGETTSLLHLQRLHAAGLIETDSVKTCETTIEGHTPPPFSLVLVIVGNVDETVKFQAGVYFSTIFCNSGTFPLCVGFHAASKDSFSCVTGVHRWKLDDEFQMNSPFMGNETTLRESYACFRRELDIHFSKSHPRGVWVDRWLLRVSTLERNQPYTKLFVVNDARDEKELDFVRSLPCAVVICIGPQISYPPDLHFDTLASLRMFGMPLLADLLGGRFGHILSQHQQENK